MSNVSFDDIFITVIGIGFLYYLYRPIDIEKDDEDVR